MHGHVGGIYTKIHVDCINLTIYVKGVRIRVVCREELDR